MAAMRSIHPFPARMAPDAISTWLDELPNNALVLDPMCGSGVVLRQAIAQGCRARGFDVDPLAVLMSRVWTSAADVSELNTCAAIVVQEARRIRARYTALPVVRACPETKQFIEYWFSEPQRTALARLSLVLADQKGYVDQNCFDALLLALSRTIVTKHVGASLAWDVSHSRPHRKREINDYDVEAGFLRSAARLAELLASDRPDRAASVSQGDCRALNSVADGEVDAIFTSPPYLNAIDYLRGHKLALVWMGYTIPHLRSIRAAAVGTENTGWIKRKVKSDIAERIEDHLPNVAVLPIRHRRIVHKYASDSWGMLAEMKRVLKSDGCLVLVLADSVVRGVEVQSSSIFGWVAMQHGFRLRKREVRAIPENKRYLPINSSSDALKRRMRSEIIQVFDVA
ncbi:site-specific DNA-methyltransferase [Lysobacter sp. Root667]|uniref:site-specific DNA-methyltransferase n=1 Tax=Lysobacter sp. Root667 TaxID=1736581 RepID=UPI000B1D60EF|nr:site-specific DNA-methyltransferase [Lysobacter sp. Root667]